MDDSGAPSKRPLSGWRQWAAAALPVVILLRALLLVHQLHEEHENRRPGASVHANTIPHSGLTLRLNDGVQNLRTWTARPDARPFKVQLLGHGLSVLPVAATCTLELATMLRHSGGLLSLLSHDKSGAWKADWSGGSTAPATQDCGSTATVRIRAGAVRDLLDILAGRPLTAPDPADKG